MHGHAEEPAGSPSAGGPAFLAVGKIRRPHGVAGDVLVELYTDFPQRIKTLKTVFAGQDHLPLKICRRRIHNDGILLAFDGFETPEQVGRFRNQVLYIRTSEAMDLPAGEFYFHELIGISVVDDNGKCLGEITEIIQTGANDVYVVANDTGREILLPAISEVILNLDPIARSMIVHLLPGLVDDEDLDA
jgi:16S rRNA processing protein RimM